jgi:hypothetical protein
VPDERHVHVAIVLVSERKRPSSASMLVITPILGDAPCKPTFRQLGAAVHRDAASGADADLFGHGQPLAQKLEFLAVSCGIAPQHFHVLLGVEAHHHDALHAVPVGAHAGTFCAM